MTITSMGPLPDDCKIQGHVAALRNDFVRQSKLDLEGGWRFLRRDPHTNNLILRNIPQKTKIPFLPLTTGVSRKLSI